MPRHVILDVDVGSDDAFALLLLLANKDVEILAITCVYGNTLVENVYVNVQRILKLCKKKEIPVYIGASEPLVKHDDHFNSYWHGFDGLADLEYEDDNVTVKDNEFNKDQLSRDTKRKTSEKHGNIKTENAINIMNQLVMAKPGEVSLICLAPLTNIALATKLNPEFSRNVKDVFIMGGNHKGIGNVTPTAEFNFHIDPEAAFIVLQSFKCPITILPWEPCQNTSIPLDWRYNTLGKSSHPAFHLLNVAERRLYNDGKFWVVCDAFLAAAFLTKNIALSSHKCHATVELHDLRKRGQMIINHTINKDTNLTIITEIDEKLFQEMMLEMASL